jgi:hypothetical protein
MKIFDTFEEVAGMNPCMQRPVIVHAKKIDEAFQVIHPYSGSYKKGKPGDYLVRGIDGELYICDGYIFELSYDMVVES